eukprot:m.332650 g.332650  ORF g.332650 m.332650 type:complete len:1757 (-) comp16061_c1_seq5:1063-6333(-)
MQSRQAVQHGCSSFKRLCLRVSDSKAFENGVLLIILANCVTLALYNPEDPLCTTQRCITLERFEIAFTCLFIVEFVVLMTALGLKEYFSSSARRLDCLIVLIGLIDFIPGVASNSLSVLRALRVLKPLRMINQFKSLQLLVRLLWDIVPMLGSLGIITMAMFSTFGIVGIQLWKGVLQTRCVNTVTNQTLVAASGFPLTCHNLSSHSATLDTASPAASTCQAYTDQAVQCMKVAVATPFTGPVSFNSILHACYAIFQVITLEGWVSIMRAVQDAWSFWCWPFFVCIIFTGSWFVVNLALVVIATQFKVTKQRVQTERERHASTGTRSPAPSLWLSMITRIARQFRWIGGSETIISNHEAQMEAIEHADHLNDEEKANMLATLEVFRMFDVNGDGTISVDELRQALQSAQDDLHEDDINELIGTIDENGDGNIDFTEFLHMMQKAREFSSRDSGDNGATSSQLLGADVVVSVQAPSAGHSPQHSTVGAQVPIVGFPSIVPLHSHHSTMMQLSSGTLLDDLSHHIADLQCESSYHVAAEHSTGSMWHVRSANGADGQHVHEYTPASHSTVSMCQEHCAFPASPEAKPGGAKMEFQSASARSDDDDDDGHGVIEALPPVLAGSTPPVCWGENDSSASNDMFAPMHSNSKHAQEVAPERLTVVLKRAATRVVHSSLFRHFVSGMIFLNMVFLAAQHEGQSENVTRTVEAANIVFTVIFAVELALKLFALRFVGYFSDPFNAFDMLIVLLSIVDLLISFSGFSIVRSFRILRLFSLLRTFPSLRSQLNVMIKTLDNVMTFLLFLFLFVFIAAIAAMHFFGNRIDPASLPDHLQHATFNRFGVAAVTVFQILTTEEWDVVAGAVMQSVGTGAAVYFIVVITFGTYILLNLFIAIMVEGFATDPSALARFKRAVLQTRLVINNLVMRKALIADAKPDSDNVQDEQSLARDDWDSHCDILHKTGSDECLASTVWKGTSGTEREHGKHHGPQDATARQRASQVLRSRWRLCCPCGVQRSVTRVRYHCQHLVTHRAFDDIVLVLIVLSAVALALQWPDQSHTMLLALQRVHTSFTIIFTIEAALKIAGLGLWGSRRAYLSSGWNILDGGLVVVGWVDLILSLSGANNSVLRALRGLRTLRAFRPLRMINRVPKLKQTVTTLFVSVRPLASVATIGIAFYLVFGVIGIELLRGRLHSCVPNPANVSFLSSTTATQSPQWAPTIPQISATTATTTKIVLSTIPPAQTTLKSVHHLLLSGAFNESMCRQLGGIWHALPYNFDHLPNAVLTLFVVSSRDGWISVLSGALKTSNAIPVYLYFVTFLLVVGYFVLNMFVGVLVENFQRTMPLMLRVPSSSSHASQRSSRSIQTVCDGGDVKTGDGNDDDGSASLPGTSQGTSQQTSCLPMETTVRCSQLDPSTRTQEEHSDEWVDKASQDPAQTQERTRWSVVVASCNTVADHRWTGTVVNVAICLNIVLMMSEHSSQPELWTTTLRAFDWFFTLVFILECCLKLIGSGVYGFWASSWNRLDLFVAFSSLVAAALDSASVHLPVNPTILRIARIAKIARLFKLMRVAQGVRSLLQTVGKSASHVGHLTLLLLLLFFCAAIMGVELFGDIQCTMDMPCQGLSHYANFENVGLAMLLLFQVATGDNWSAVLQDILREPPLCNASATECTANCCSNKLVASLYFVIFVVLAQFILLNVVVAVLMKNLADSMGTPDSLQDEATRDIMQQVLEENRRVSVRTEAFCSLSINLIDKTFGGGMRKEVYY